MRIPEQKDSGFPRRLISLNVVWDGTDMFIMTFPGDTITFRGTPEGFAKFLKNKLKAADAMTAPNSKRGVTYKEIVDAILNGQCKTIWVWNYILKDVDKKAYSGE